MKTSLRFLFPLLLVALLDSSYGQTPTPTQSPDIAPSGYVDMMDLFVLSASWKAMTGPEYGDLDGSGTVGAEDLLRLLANWHKSLLPSEQTLTIPLPNLPAGARQMKLVRIPAGTFQMGNTGTSRDGNYSSELPRHEVNIGYNFYIGETEVTQGQWQAIMGSIPSSSYGVGSDLPVYNVDWNDCQSFISALNAVGQVTFRLPSEAEWEYACRGPASNQNRYAPFSFGDDLSVSLYGTQFSNLFDRYMWWRGNAPDSGPRFTYHPVGGKLPNDFGLYDMHGNVWEWCQDNWHGSYTGAPSDGSSWIYPTSPYRVRRGGFWNQDAGHCRSADRNFNKPVVGGLNIGFRLAWTP